MNVFASHLISMDVVMCVCMMPLMGSVDSDRCSVRSTAKY
jgi:hypothetical protein